MLRSECKAAESGDAVVAGMFGYAIMTGLDGSYHLVEAAMWLTLASEHARPSNWHIQAAVYSQDVQNKLTPQEREAFHACLIHWQSALDDE